MALSVAILYNSSNTFGLQDDIVVIERILKKIQSVSDISILKPKVKDIREPHTHYDIQFHLEIPCFSAIPWGHTNIMLVNPEQWSYAYDVYVHAFDAFIFRDTSSANEFQTAFQNANTYVIPWCSSWQKTPQEKHEKHEKHEKQINEFISFIAGSTNKYEYLTKLVPSWRESDPPLTIYTTRKDFAEGLKKNNLAKNVTVIQEDLNKEKQQLLAGSYRGHLVCSQGEGYGYAAANAEVCGAFTIMNKLPVFEFMYTDSKRVGWISNMYTTSTAFRYNHASPSDKLREELDSVFEQFATDIFQHNTVNRFENTVNAFLPVIHLLHKLVTERRPKKGIFHCPPILRVEDCPPISIITPTYNRKKLIDIAFHNLLATDYPHDKIEWVVIEDNEKTPHMASDKVIKFQVQAPDIKVKYIPIEGRMTIGEKRNHAIEHSLHDIILFMDDDDHYPSTSFRRRVAWLLKGLKCGASSQIACCTTLPLYDLMRGISAINVPPFDIPLSQRISEATLTFKKSAWLERKFPNVSIAEGEHWIQGREQDVIEIPPQQIIVAFTHGTNQSSRHVPPDTKPSCFWGFPKEYLIFIHGLVGVEIEDSKK